MVIMKTKKVKKLNAPKSFNNAMQAERNDEIDDGASDDEEAPPKVSKEIRIIAQEVSIVRALACNDLIKRNRQIRKLRKWFQLRAASSFPFSAEDFMRIWKGLYYNMWMSDKPLVQEELAEQLAQLLECFNDDVATSINFFGAFLRTMCNEWFGIDQWRIDKFMMLTRRMLRYMFRVLRRAGWCSEHLQLLNEQVKLSVLADECPAIGLTMHYLDIYFEELAKVSEGKMSAEQVGDFVRPFVTFMGKQQDAQLVSHCRTQVFSHLLFQSALGREYSDKYKAWQQMGFATGSIKNLEKIAEDDTSAAEDNDDEEEAAERAQPQPLDPRAGNVDVFMPELKFDAKYIIEELEKLLYKDEEISTKRRKVLRKLLTTLQKYQRGEFPLGVKRMPRFEAKSDQPLMKSKINQLEQIEDELFSVGRKLKQLTKRKRRKLLKSLNYDNVDESNIDQTILKALPKQYLNERKRKAQAAMMSGWLEEEIDAEDVPPKKKTKNKKTPNKQENLKEDNETNAKKETAARAPNVQADISLKKELDPRPIKEKQIKVAAKKVNDTQAPNEKSTPATTEKTNSPGEVSKGKKKKSDMDEDSVPAAVGLLNSVETPTKPKKSKSSIEEAPLTHTAEKSSNSIETVKTPKSKSALNVSLSAAAEKIFNSIDVTKAKKSKSLWALPMEEGEVEYFIPARKIQVQKANAALVVNPLARKSTSFTPNSAKSAATSLANTPKTPSSVKRVKIALKHNTAQNPSEYIKQIKSSPNLPFDADKKPSKGLLKPNSMPSPINPFYKRKIGLRLMNDTM